LSGFSSFFEEKPGSFIPSIFSSIFYTFGMSAVPIKHIVEIRIPIKGILNQYFFANTRYDKLIMTGRKEN